MVAGIFPPDRGGPASYVPQMATELVRRGHEIRVICLSDSLDHDDRSFAFPVLRLRRAMFKPWRAVATVWAILRWSRWADVAYVNGLAFEMLLAASLTRLPCVHKIVGDSAWERARNRGWFLGTLDEYQRARKGLRLLVLDWVRAIPLRHAQKVIVPSEYLRRVVGGWGLPRGKTVVVYNAVPLRAGVALAPSLPGFNGRTLITVCRLVPWKGVEDLIRVVGTVPQWRLVVVGDGPLRSRLEALGEVLGLRERVIFTGSVPPDAVARLLETADVFVLNSSYEGLPHVVAEATRAGLPVVATNVGGTPEIVQDGRTGLLVPAGDRDSLRRAVENVVEHPELRRALVAHAQEALRTTFSYERCVRTTEYLLVKAAGDKEADQIQSRGGCG